MKPFPALNSDEQAEAIVADANLTEFDPSEIVTVRFDHANAAGILMLPDCLSAASREKAAHLGIPLETFVRSAIERALAADGRLR